MDLVTEIKLKIMHSHQSMPIGRTILVLKILINANTTIYIIIYIWNYNSVNYNHINMFSDHICIRLKCKNVEIPTLGRVSMQLDKLHLDSAFDLLLHLLNLKIYVMND